MRHDYTPKDDFEGESFKEYSAKFEVAEKKFNEAKQAYNDEVESLWRAHTARIRKHRKAKAEGVRP